MPSRTAAPAGLSPRLFCIRKLSTRAVTLCTSTKVRRPIRTGTNFSAAMRRQTVRGVIPPSWRAVSAMFHSKESVIYTSLMRGITKNIISFRTIPHQLLCRDEHLRNSCRKSPIFQRCPSMQAQPAMATPPGTAHWPAPLLANHPIAWPRIPEIKVLISFCYTIFIILSVTIGLANVASGKRGLPTC